MNRSGSASREELSSMSTKDKVNQQASTTPGKPGNNPKQSPQSSSSVHGGQGGGNASQAFRGTVEHRGLPVERLRVEEGQAGPPEEAGPSGNVQSEGPPQLMLFSREGDLGDRVSSELMNVANEEEFSGFPNQHNMIMEQDRFLPIANIARIMKRVIPNEGKVAKDAKECCQECVSEFISFITSEASERCLNEKRKTINGEDLLYAMQTLGFDNYIDPLKIYLARYREAQKGDKATVIMSGGANTMNTMVNNMTNPKSDDDNPVQIQVGAANQPGSIALQLQGGMFVDPASGHSYMSINTPSGPQLVQVMTSAAFEQASGAGATMHQEEPEQEEEGS